MHTSRNSHNRGIALLVTLLVMGILLAVSAILINLTLKQFRLANIAESSEIAFQAATAGLECILFRDVETDLFKIGDPHVNSIECMGDFGDINYFGGSNITIENGEEQRFQFEWGSPARCSEVSVYKFFSDSGNVLMQLPNGETPRNPINSDDSINQCVQGFSCMVIKARGYNDACDSFGPRTVEREITHVY